MPAHLRRVNARRDEDDGLPVAERLLSGGAGAEGAGIGEPGVQAPVPVQLPQVAWARNHERHERRPQRRLADLAVVDPITRPRQGLVIAHQDRPLGELAVVAGVESENRSRRRNDDCGRAWPRAPRSGTRRALRRCQTRRRPEPQDRERDPRAGSPQRRLPAAAGGASPVPIQCANHVRIRSRRSTSNHGGPVRDKP